MAHVTSGRPGGFTSGFDLRPHERHEGISCDGCNANPIIGVRYRCSQCANFDLCEACLSRYELGELSHGTPSEEHLFLRVSKHLKGRADLESRAMSVHNVPCSGCNASVITGYRFSCQLCVNVHLCEACEALGTKHDPTHPRLKAWAAPQTPAPSAPQSAISKPAVANSFAPPTFPSSGDSSTVMFGMVHTSSGRSGNFTAFGQGPFN